jgi:hypothetical protein
MDEGSWNKKTVSSFTFPVHAASENTSSFTVKYDAVDTQWLINTRAQARKLIDQRSNVDLLCLFTCLNRAKELQSAGKDGPSSGNQEWIDNLLGQSCSDHDVDITAQKEFLFFQDNVFGGQEHARIGLRMIPAFYHRDYALVRDIYLEGQEGAAKNKITAALNKHEQTGSFPTGRPFPNRLGSTF